MEYVEVRVNQKMMSNKTYVGFITNEHFDNQTWTFCQNQWGVEARTKRQRKLGDLGDGFVGVEC